MNNIKLHWQILIAIVLAVIIGTVIDADARIFGVSWVNIFDFFGKLFLNALKMIIVPLIMSSIINGIAGISGDAALGRLGGKTLAYYASTSLIAILIGLTLVNIIEPGIVDGVPQKEALNLPALDANKRAAIAEKDTGDIAEVFIRMVPPNIISAATDNGQMLGLIFFSLLFGYFMTRIQKDNAATLMSFWQGLFETMMNITLFVMKFAPIGVFGLVAKTIALTGFESFKPLLWFFMTTVLALAVHMFVAMPLILRFVGKVNPLRHFRAMSPAMLTAFSTASSSATLPVTLECIEKNAGVSNRTSSFVLPLGATVNMDGTALYECVAAMFIAQAYGFDLTFSTQFTIVIVALLTSIGVAGIPSASLVAIAIILSTIGLPLEALGLILATDRILDMCRTSVNIFSDSCGAVVIAKSEGEQDVLTNQEAA